MAGIHVISFTVLFNLIIVIAQDFTTIVDVPDLGKIEGNRAFTARDQRPYWIFHGIPYANPESYVGPGKRFKPSEVMSEPLTADGSVFQANRLRVFCPQEALIDLTSNDLNDISVVWPAMRKNRQIKFSRFRNSSFTARMDVPKSWGQEDCLTININTPIIPRNEDEQLLPVILFIHGGGSTQMWGSAFTGLRILEKDVVLVTINYRLGTLGALDLGIDDAPGCAALYDAITSLKWIQQYISYFGGDPTRVTISGHSAGAMMVTHLMLSPLANGLFQGVWGLSGSALNIWATAPGPTLRHHLDVAFYANCFDRQLMPIEEANLAEVTECMNHKTIDQLVHAMSLYQFQEASAGKLGYDARVPGVQSPSLTIPRFLAEPPHQIIEGNKYTAVPLVLGATAHDGAFVVDDIYNDYLVPTDLINNATYLRNDMFPEMLQTFGIKDTTGGLYHVMAKTYLEDAENDPSFDARVPGFVDIATVIGMKGAQYKMVEYNAKVEPRSYFYSLDYKGRWTMCDILGGNQLLPGGICHGDDMIYAFYFGPLFNDDMKVSRRFVDYLVNFAYYGNPTPSELSERKLEWLPYDDTRHTYLSINRVDSIGFQCPDSWIGVAKHLLKNNNTVQ